MEFKTIKKNHKNKIIIGGLIGIGLASALIYLPSRAKYRTTESFNIVNGEITYKVPDFNIVAMFSSEDGSNYTELTGRMPDSGYAINEEKSYCNLNGSKDNNVTLKTVNGVQSFTNITKGDKCYLYFDKTPTNIEEVLSNITIKTENINFENAATTDEGIYKISDGMYGGTSYYYRGAVTNNYIKFAGFCWRIIRINGDKSIRIIYDGTTCHDNGIKTTESISLLSPKYNDTSNSSEYAGYTYRNNYQRPTNITSGTNSKLKEQTDNWYKINLTNYSSKIAEGKFCNDRNTATGSTWTKNQASFFYAAYDRLKAPSLGCSTNDTYILTIGHITSDEILLAGSGLVAANTSYYLYNGQWYWSMTPYGWTKENTTVTVYAINGNGGITVSHVDSPNPGIRPVINLRSDVTFSSGDGTLNSPYIVQ